MNELLNKISLYDQLGYIAVGGMLYGFLYYDFSYFNFDLNVTCGNTLFISLTVYFLGHVVQAIANQFIKESKTTYSEIHKNLFSDIKAYFNVRSISDGEAWSICYLWAIGNDKTGHINAFNAKYGLYRGWSVVLAMQSITLAGFIIYESKNYEFKIANLIGLLISSALSWLFLKRSQRFYKYLGNKVFEVFIIKDK